MAEVAARKRARSSSPVCDVLASPLEVLLKRRRRDLSRTSSVALPPPSQPIFDPPSGMPGPSGGDAAMPSSSSPGLPTSSSPGFGDYSHDANSLRGIERRRTRNWERLNAPALAGPSCEPDSSPVARRSTSDRHLVSSSPVRHQPPAPVFRDEWSAEERLREWGDEYSSQNTVLHSLVSRVAGVVTHVDGRHSFASSASSQLMCSISPASRANSLCTACTRLRVRRMSRSSSPSQQRVQHRTQQAHLYGRQQARTHGARIRLPASLPAASRRASTSRRPCSRPRRTLALTIHTPHQAAPVNLMGRSAQATRRRTAFLPNSTLPACVDTTP